MAEVEGFEDMLAELKTRPGVWRLMATVESDFLAIALQSAFDRAVEERMKPQERFTFAWREPVSGEFSVYGRYEPPEP